MAYYGVGDGWCFSCGGFAGHVKLMFINGATLDPAPPVTPVGMGKSTGRLAAKASRDRYTHDTRAEYQKKDLNAVFGAPYWVYLTAYPNLGVPGYLNCPAILFDCPLRWPWLRGAGLLAEARRGVLVMASVPAVTARASPSSGVSLQRQLIPRQIEHRPADKMREI
jgi:hypothetical protein